MPLDSSRLASRIRDLVRGARHPARTSDEVRPLDDRDAPPGSTSGLHYVADPDADALWSAPGGCAIIERHYDLDFWHGRMPVGDYAGALEKSRGAFAVLGSRGPARDESPPRSGFDFRDRIGPSASDRRDAIPLDGPLLFFDIETTGLSGGAGTVAFLVGCGHFEPDGFHTKQFFLSGYEAERELLAALTALLERFAGLVTFNGRTFDIPIVETRYLFHRLESPFEGVPHLDMLPPARRLWRRRSSAFEDGIRGRSGRTPGSESCTLGALELDVLGVGRDGDVPGFEIPSRYFHYLRTGDGSGLEAVFEHNRLDVLSLAAIAAVASRLVEDGPSSAISPREALALGESFERSGRGEEAVRCYGRVAGIGDAAWEPASVEAGVRAEALRRLAVLRRRQRRYLEAAEAWTQLAAMDEFRTYRAEAIQALAIHHEHRVKDLERARGYARQGLESARDPSEADALKHRLNRLERKMDGCGPAGLKRAR